MLSNFQTFSPDERVSLFTEANVVQHEKTFHVAVR